MVSALATWFTWDRRGDFSLPHAGGSGLIDMERVTAALVTDN